MRLWFYALLLYVEAPAGLSQNFLLRQLGLTNKASWGLANKIRIHLATVDVPRCVGGPGIKDYVDEATVSVGKSHKTMSLFGITDGRNVSIKIVPDRRARTLLPIIEEVVRPGSIVISDGYRSYNRLAELGFTHRRVLHGRRMWVNEHGDHTVPVETLWAQCKHLLKGRAGQVEPENLWKFVSEVIFRAHHSLDPEASYWRLITGFKSISRSNIDAARLHVDRRPQDVVEADAALPAAMTTAARPRR